MIASCSFCFERLQQRITDFGHSRYFTKLFGAAHACNPGQCGAFVGDGRAAPVETLRAAPTGPLSLRCVGGNGLNTCPAFLHERMKDLGDTAAHFEEKRHSEVGVSS